MAYIYKKNVKGKEYYYLRVSKRIKGKVIVKDVAYLGDDVLKIQDKLNELPDVHKKEIRKAYQNIQKYIETEHYLKKVKKLKLKSDDYLDRKTLEEVESIKLHFKERFLKLDELTKKEFYKNFLIEFAFNTTSLEGNTITLEEAAKLLQENRTPKNRTLREIYDLQNTEKVFFDLFEKNKKISHDFIIQIHDSLLENIDERKCYRTRDIRVFRSNFETSPGEYVKTDMSLLLEWYNENKKKFHPLVIAALFHQKFEIIHPFYDGNGRTGRIIMNYMLMKEGYPPLIVQEKLRDEYLGAMKQGDKARIKEVSPKFYKDIVQFLADMTIVGYWGNFLV